MYGELPKAETSAMRFTNNMEGEAPATEDFTEKRVGKWEKDCTKCSQAPALSQNPDKTERQRGRDKNRFFFFTSLEGILHISHVSLH